MLALWLEVVGHMTSFSQLECFCFRIVLSYNAITCKWHSLEVVIGRNSANLAVSFHSFDVQHLPASRWGPSCTPSCTCVRPFPIFWNTRWTWRTRTHRLRYLTPSIKVLKILIGMAIFLHNKKEKNTKITASGIGQINRTKDIYK